jgi:hypothetical protein
MSDLARQKKLESAKKKLKKFQEAKSSPTEPVTTISSLPGLSSTPTKTYRNTAESTPVSHGSTIERKTLDFSRNDIPATTPVTQVQSSVYSSTIIDMGDSPTDQVLDDSNMDLTEVDLQQKLTSYKRSNGLLVTQVNEQRRQLLTLQERLKQANAVDHKALSEQLEVHIQTIGILVQESNTIQSSVASLQKKLSVKEAEILDSNVKLSTSRKHIQDQEKAINEFKSGLEKSNTVNKNVVTERDKYMNKLYETSSEKDDIELQNQELKQKLQTKIQECSLLLNQINELNAKLQKAEIVAQQVLNQDPSEVQTSQNKWNQEKSDLERNLQQQCEIVNTLVAEKAYFLERENDTKEHYESLIDHLESKINNHKTAEQDPQTRISELETELLSFKEQQSVAEEGVKIDEEPESEKGAEENQQAEAASNELAEEKRVVEMELDIQVKENRRLTRMTMDNEQQINALQVEIERLSKLSEDRESLLEKSQADQETISRALLQNKQLKEQLEELQEAFVKMSTSSADLSAKLETEQYGGKDVAEKLEANVIEMEELKQQVNVSISEKTETEEQLTLARHDCEALQQKVISKEMDLDIAATELQKTKTELNRQIQLYTDLQQLKETLCFQLHGELESAQEAINKLSTENLALVQQ